MSKLIAGHILVVALLLLCAPVPINAQDSVNPERASLKGLDGVMVLVEELRPDIIADGVTTDMIQSTVEGRLRDAGIRVLSEDELRSTPGFPYLYINLNTIKPQGASGYIYAIDIELYQAVVLDRDSGNKCLAATWETSMVGMAPASSIKDITTRILRLVDEFAGDYKAANKATAPFSAHLKQMSNYDNAFASGFDFKDYLRHPSWLDEVNKHAGISSSLLVDEGSR